MKDADTQIFAGLLKCADCGWSMSFGTNRQNSKPYSYFNCTKYRQYGKTAYTCSVHYIRYDTLYTYVLSRIQYWKERAQVNESALLKQILDGQNTNQKAEMQKKSAMLSKAEKRMAEVNILFAKLYEDRVSEKISEYNFTLLSQKYQTEQEELQNSIAALQNDLAAGKQAETDAEKWLSLVRQYSAPTDLTAEMLNALIEKIVIHEAVKQPDGTRKQEIEIYYRFIGKIE